MEKPPRPSSSASRASTYSPASPSVTSKPGTSSGKSKQRRQKWQEEFAAVPSCPMLYALIPPELQPHSRGFGRPDSAPQDGRQKSGTPQESTLSAPPITPRPATTPTPTDPLHLRARSWDVNDLGRQMLVEQNQPWVCRLMFQSLSLAVECLVDTAMVTMEATWIMDDVPLPASASGGLDCLFVLPLTDQATVCGVEVLPSPSRMLATAVVPHDEADMASRHMALLQQHQQQSRDQPSDKQIPRTATNLRQRLFPRSLSSNAHSRNSSNQGGGASTSGSSGGGSSPLTLRSLSHRRLFSSRSEQDKSNQSDGRTTPIASIRSQDDMQSHPWVHDPQAERPSSGGSLGSQSSLEGGGRGEDDEASSAARAALMESPLLSRKVDPQVGTVLMQEPEGFCASMFRLRIPHVLPGATVQVRVTYLERMRMLPGCFNEITVPLTIPWDCLPSGVPLHEALKVSCMINSGIQQPMKIGDFNHPMKVLFVELGRATFVGFPDPSDPESWPNTHFTASFQVVGEEAHAGVLVQAPVVAALDARATFCLTMCLPDISTPLKPLFKRAVVFVIDSNASLRSKQMDDARRAIASSLRRLDPTDAFMLVAYDYELLTSSEHLELATPEAVKKACKFILRAHDCECPSNILTPLDLALQVLKTYCQEEKKGESEDPSGASTASAPPVPQIVLVTDGSVGEERGICQHVQNVLLDWGRNPPRIFSFGIGPQCNFYFLKWLASVSRGTTCMAYNLEEVRSRLDKMLQSISRPLVTNVTIKELPPGCELYPFPIPDLYLGVPVVVTGKMGGVDEQGNGPGEFGLPSHLHLRGTHADGSSWRCKAQLVEAGNVPLNSVGIKEQVEILSADAWLHEDSSIEDMVSALSMSASVPCENTRLVFFETKDPLFQDFQRHRVQGIRGDIKTYADPLSPYLVQVPGLYRGFGKSANTFTVKEDEGDGASGERGSRTLQSRQSMRENMASGGMNGQDEGYEDEGVEGGTGRDSVERMTSLVVTRQKGFLVSAFGCYFPKEQKQ